MKVQQDFRGPVLLVWMVGAAFLGCCLTGCGGGGGEPASLSGTVKYSGELIPEGSIRLNPKEGTPGNGGAAPIKDGSFSIAASETLKAGEHTVMIFAMRGTGEMFEVEPEMRDATEEGTEEDADDEGDLGEGGMEEVTEQYLPEKYNRGSKITIDLAAGENTKDWDLEP